MKRTRKPKQPKAKLRGITIHLRWAWSKGYRSTVAAHIRALSATQRMPFVGDAPIVRRGGERSVFDRYEISDADDLHRMRAALAILARRGIGGPFVSVNVDSISAIQCEAEDGTVHLVNLAPRCKWQPPHTSETFGPEYHAAWERAAA